MSEAGLTAERPSVGIIGGGIIGLSIAWRLAQKKFRVSVFDKGNAGGEASWAGAGMLSPGGEIDRISPFAQLLIESRSLYGAFVKELEQASGTRIDYQECGALELAYSAAEADALAATSRTRSQLGIVSKAVSPEHVAAFWPRVRREGLVGAFFYPGDGIVDPRDVVAALKIACSGLRVELFEGCAVSAVDVEKSQVRLQTERGTVGFDYAVLAAGAWSSSIAVNGVSPLPPAEPVKGHLVGYRQPVEVCNTILRHGHSYVLQRANGLLIAGASEEHVGFDRSLDQNIAAALAKEAALLLPHLEETTPSEVWTGFRPGADALQLGSWRSSRLYTAYGHYRNGILLAPVTAARIADEISANSRMP